MKALKIVLIVAAVLIVLVVGGVVLLFVVAGSKSANYWEHTQTGGEIEARYTALGSSEVSYAEYDAKDETIGKYAVIGAGSIVNRDIPDYTVAAGNPCKPIRRIDQRDKEYYWKDKRFDSQQ